MDSAYSYSPTTVLLCVGVVCVLLLIVKQVFLHPLRHLPRAHDPKEHWLLGMGPVMREDKWPLMSAVKWAAEHPNAPLLHFTMFGMHRVLVLDPDLLRQVLVTKSSLFSKRIFQYLNVKAIIGDGLVTTDGEVHSRHRKMVNEAFGYKHLKGLVPIFAEQSKILLDHWEGKDGQIVNVADGLGRMALNVLGLSTFGFEFDTLTPEETKGKKLYRLFRENVQAHKDFLFMTLPYYQHIPIEANRRRKELKRKTYEGIEVIIEEKRERLAKRKSLGSSVIPMDILELLILVTDEDDGSKFTNQELVDEAKTLLMAGTDTSATMAQFTLICLAKHPEVLQKCLEEVDRVLGNREIVEEPDLNELKYLHLVMRESMRLYPPIPILPRRVEQDINLGGYDIPAGTTLVVSPMVMHHLPNLWDNPEEFNPERFSPENDENRHPYQYLPFNHGPRNCIGQKFGFVEMKVMLAMLLKRYTLSLKPDYDFKCIHSIAMQPYPALEMILHERHPKTVAT